MNIVQEMPLTTIEMESLVRNHRRMLEALEARLVEFVPHPAPSPSETEAPVAEQAVGARALRVARNETRRAARRAARRGTGAIWMPRPPREDTSLQDLAGARASAWERTVEAMRAAEDDDPRSARAALDEVLRTESALATSIDEMSLPRAWRSLQRELLHAGDDVVECVREALAVLDWDDAHPGRVGSALSAALGAQSHWLHVWRTFVQIAPAQTACRGS